MIKKGHITGLSWEDKYPNKYIYTPSPKMEKFWKEHQNKKEK